MKRIILFSLVALTGCSLFDKKKEESKIDTANVPYEAREADETPRSRILVLPFLDEKDARTKKVADESRRIVVAELQKTRRFVVVSNQDFPHDPKKYLDDKGNYDLDAISRMASSLGVAAVVEGKILEVKAKKIGDQVGLIRQVRARIETTVRVRMYSARNGKEILNEVRTATVEDSTTRVAEYSYSDRFLEEDPGLVKLAVRDAFVGLIRNMAIAVEKLSWEGRVAMVSGERIFINAGRLSGLQVGDILKIAEDGEEVYDPETGRFIGHAPGRMKGTVELVSYFGKDGSIAVVHSGSGFKENDRVQLY